MATELSIGDRVEYMPIDTWDKCELTGEVIGFGHVKDHPVVLVRLPDGAGGFIDNPGVKCFVSTVVVLREYVRRVEDML